MNGLLPPSASSVPLVLGSGYTTFAGGNAFLMINLRSLLTATSAALNLKVWLLSPSSVVVAAPRWPETEAR